MNFKQFILEEFIGKTLQIEDIPTNLTNIIRDIQNKIPEDILINKYDEEGWIKDGISELLHITVLYGIVSGSPEEAKDIYSRYLPLRIKTKQIIYFDSPGKTVAVIECESNKLLKLHNELKETFENGHSFPNYRPHLTIAYLKSKERLENINIPSVSWQVKKIHWE